MTASRVLFSMAKSTETTRKSQTHFEQVPIEVVKRVAQQYVSKDKRSGTARVRAEPDRTKKG
jgi:hypothetical protein